MASSVQILCPNGRRQNVKVTPNTKLLQVLEEVCTNQAFLPFDDYELIHGRKTLDLTLAFRFSNLPNNAKLELVKSSAPRTQPSGEVTIALQLEDGERLQHVFQPMVTLWEILEYWENQKESLNGQLTFVDSSQTPPLHPVCIYMREEVVGEPALRITTLKKLALTSGKAIIRLIHRAVDDGTLAEIIGKIEEENVKQARLAQKIHDAEMSLSAISDTSSTSLDETASIFSTAFAEPKETTFEHMDVDDVGKEAQENSQTIKHGMKKREKSNMDTQNAKADEQSLDQEAGASSGSAHSSGVDRSVSGRGATGPNPLEQLKRMNIPGVEIIQPSDFDDLSPEEQRIARTLAERLMPGLFGSQHQISRPKTTAPKHSYSEFKFPEETKGKNLYQNEISDVKVEEFKPCDREMVIYDSNEECSSKAAAQDLPDEFFEVTEFDVRSLYRDLQRQVDSERQLTTEVMRQTQLEERHKHYIHIVVRVQFPDGLVLQGCFRPRETVFALHKFVREHLEDKKQEFHLYRTPPKQIFSDMSETLVQANLAPASLIYFGSNNKEEHSLSASYRKRIIPKRRADMLSIKKLAKKHSKAHASGNSVAAPVAVSSPSLASKAESSTRKPCDRPTCSASKPSVAASHDAKVPKWLKTGKK